MPIFVSIAAKCLLSRASCSASESRCASSTTTRSGIVPSPARVSSTNRCMSRIGMPVCRSRVRNPTAPRSSSL